MQNKNDRLAPLLVEAYEREEALYARIMDVVQEQHRVLSTEPDTEVVVDLCGLVQGLMKRISEVEAEIQPLKKQWLGRREGPDGKLAEVLDRIQDLINGIGQAQEQVQAMLLEHLVHERRQSAPGPVAVSARRAAAAYGTL